MQIAKQLDKVGFSGSDACEEPISSRGQLDLVADLQASRVCSTRPIRTKKCVLIEDNTVSRRRYKHKMQKSFLKESGGVLLTTSAILVYSLLVRFFFVARSRQWKRQELIVEISCQRDERSLSSTTLPRHSFFVAGVKTMVAGRWLVANGHAKSRDTMKRLCHVCNALRRLFCCTSCPEDENVTIPSAFVLPADVSLLEITILTNSPQIAAQLDSRFRDGQTGQTRPSLLPLGSIALSQVPSVATRSRLDHAGPEHAQCGWAGRGGRGGFGDSD